MKCPKCSEGRLRVTHTHGTDHGFTQRCVCEKCLSVCITKATIVQVDPKHGQGAAALAESMRRKKADPCTRDRP